MIRKWKYRLKSGPGLFEFLDQSSIIHYPIIDKFISSLIRESLKEYKISTMKNTINKFKWWLKDKFYSKSPGHESYPVGTWTPYTAMNGATAPDFYEYEIPADPGYYSKLMDDDHYIFQFRHGVEMRVHKDCKMKGCKAMLISEDKEMNTLGLKLMGELYNIKTI